MPIVPDIDIEGLGPLERKHDDVDHESHDDSEGRDRGTPGNSRKRGPPKIDSRHVEARALDHCLSSGSHGIPHQREDGKDADEANSSHKGRTKCLSRLDTKTKRQNKNDTRKHDGGVKTQHVLYHAGERGSQITHGVLLFQKSTDRYPAPRRRHFLKPIELSEANGWNAEIST